MTWKQLKQLKTAENNCKTDFFLKLKTAVSPMSSFQVSKGKVSQRWAKAEQKVSGGGVEGDPANSPTMQRRMLLLIFT